MSGPKGDDKKLVKVFDWRGVALVRRTHGNNLSFEQLDPLVSTEYASLEDSSRRLMHYMT